MALRQSSSAASWAGLSPLPLPLLLLLLLLCGVLPTATAGGGGGDTACVWDSFSGARFDLRQLTRAQGETAYSIHDGDIECTRDVEETEFYYAFNFCADVSIDDVKDVSPGCEGLQGAAVQWLAEGFDDCNIIGTYDPNEDEKIWSLYDEDDPSKGVTLSYIGSPTNKCGSDKSITRTLTLDVVCADKAEPAVQFAQEPELCQYHIAVESRYGCPAECEWADGHLCGGHGHCAYDPLLEKPRCYCNQDYTGSDCTEKNTSSGSGSLAVQITLVVVLLIVTIALIAVVVYMSKQVQDYRKLQQSEEFSNLPESEMVTQGDF